METKLNLSDICDMVEFEKILSDWAITSHMSAIVRDVNHKYITNKYGFKDYCMQMLSSEKANIACKSYEDDANIFCCHAGLCDFFGDPMKANIPIIAMTANAFDEYKRNALAAGMNGHLAKPIEIDKLMHTLAEILK